MGPHMEIITESYFLEKEIVFVFSIPNENDANEVNIACKSVFQLNQHN